MTGSALSQAVTSRPLTTEALVRALVNLCGIYGRQSVPVTGLSRSSSVFPVSIIPPWLFILIFHWGMNNRLTDGRSSETFSHPFDVYNIEQCDECGNV
jgi:hypothetical protein